MKQITILIAILMSVLNRLAYMLSVEGANSDEIRFNNYQVGI